MKRYLTLILAAALLLAQLTACGSGGSTPSDTTASGSDTTTVPDTAAEYVYPELDMKGETFTILNTAQDYNFYTTLDVEEETGDSLDDAIYRRNTALEERYNFTLAINEDYKLEKAAGALQTAVLAGDDIYDAAFIRDYYITSAITEGYLIDMQDIEEFQFDQPWWDTAAIEASRLGSKRSILYAFTDVSLADFEGTVCCFFNENIMTDLNLETPYQLVRDGKWTIDRLAEYMKAGANLNGDDSFTWNVNGSATYGMTSWTQCTSALLLGSDEDFVTIDKDAQPCFATQGDRFYTVAEKILDMLLVEGEYIHTPDSTTGHYEMLFKNGRSLFMLAQLKAANGYRDMNDTYGIVPIPKYDESQENYHNLRSYTYLLCLPVTNKEPEKTAVIMDAMSYITYTDIMDIFYHGRVSQKSLRNEESIEMMNIIRETRYADLGIPYGWSSPVRDILSNAVINKQPEIASKIAGQQAAVEQSMEDIMALLN